MNIIEDLYYVNKKTIIKTFKLFTKNWMLALTFFVYYLLSIVVFLVIGTIFRGILSIFSGILFFVVTSALLSNFLYLLNQIIRYGKFTFNDFKSGFTAYLWKIYGILFIAWAATYLLNAIMRLGFNNFAVLGILSTVISIVLLIVLNPLPETIYQKHYSSWETIVYTFNFIKESWIEWFAPNIIIMIVLYFTTGRIVANLTSLIFINFSLNLSYLNIILQLITPLLISFIMIYRGVLFEILSTSTRRKRKFMRGMYK